MTMHDHFSYTYLSTGQYGQFLEAQLVVHCSEPQVACSIPTEVKQSCKFQLAQCGYVQSNRR